MQIQLIYVLASVVVFGWLGQHLARKRNRSGVPWGVAAALFPPLLLILFLLKPGITDEEDESTDGELSEG